MQKLIYNISSCHTLIRWKAPNQFIFEFICTQRHCRRIGGMSSSDVDADLRPYTSLLVAYCWGWAAQFGRIIVRRKWPRPRHRDRYHNPANTNIITSLAMFTNVFTPLIADPCPQCFVTVMTSSILHYCNAGVRLYDSDIEWRRQGTRWSIARQNYWPALRLHAGHQPTDGTSQCIHSCSIDFLVVKQTSIKVAFRSFGRPASERFVCEAA